MDVRGIGERLGKQAAVSDGGYAARMARVKQLVDSQPKTQFGGFMRGLGEGAAQGVGNLANAYSFGLTDRYGLTHTNQYVNDAANKWSKGLALTSAIAMPAGGILRGGTRLAQAARAGKASPALSKVYAALRGRNLTAAQQAELARRWAARNSLKSWTDSANMTLGMVGGGGAATKGVAAATTGGSKVLSAIRGLLRTRNAATAVRAAAPAVRTGSAVGDWARFLSMAPVPRPTAAFSYMLRTPSYMRSLAKLPLAIPGVRPGLSALARTRMLRPVARGVRAADNAYLRLAGTRPVQALSRLGNFVEGGGGRASKAFMVADAAVPMYAGIKYFDPQFEATARALGYDSQFVADVSTTPGSFVPAARIQPPLHNTVPGMVNERRMRKWVDQYGRDIQALTDEQTAASRKLLSRRY